MWLVILGGLLFALGRSQLAPPSEAAIKNDFFNSTETFEVAYGLSITTALLSALTGRVTPIFLSYRATTMLSVCGQPHSVVTFSRLPLAISITLNDPQWAYYGGNVVLNSYAIIAFAAVGAIAAKAMAARQKATFVRGLESVRMPGVLIVAIVFFLQPTIVSAVTILRHETDPFAVSMAAVSFAAWILVPGGFLARALVHVPQRAAYLQNYYQLHNSLKAQMELKRCIAAIEHEREMELGVRTDSVFQLFAPLLREKSPTAPIGENECLVSYNVTFSKMLARALDRADSTHLDETLLRGTDKWEDLDSHAARLAASQETMEASPTEDNAFSMVRCFGHIFAMYRRPYYWFIVVECSCTLVCAAVEGWSPRSAAASSCYAQTSLLLGAMVLYVILNVALSPLISPFEGKMTLLVAALELVAAAGVGISIATSVGWVSTAVYLVTLLALYVLFVWAVVNAYHDLYGRWGQSQQVQWPTIAPLTALYTDMHRTRREKDNEGFRRERFVSSRGVPDALHPFVREPLPPYPALVPKTSKNVETIKMDMQREIHFLRKKLNIRGADTVAPESSFMSSTLRNDAQLWKTLRHLTETEGGGGRTMASMQAGPQRFLGASMASVAERPSDVEHPPTTTKTPEMSWRQRQQDMTSSASRTLSTLLQSMSYDPDL